MDDKDKDDQAPDIEELFEVVPIQPIDLDTMFQHVESSLDFSEDEADESQIVLGESNLVVFKDYLKRAHEYRLAYDRDAAWYFLLRAEAMIRFQCGVREGIFRAGQRKKASEEELAAKKAEEQKKFDALVAHMEGIKGKWHNRDDFDFELRRHAREIDFTLGPQRAKAVYADARITKLVAEIKPGARKAPGRST